MKIDVYYRKSTEQWIYGVIGVNYVFRYSHKYKIIAWVIYKLSVKDDIESMNVH